MLSSLGPRRSFERGSLIAAVAYTLLSQACRPVGAPGMRLAVQYVLAKCLLMTPWSEPARFAILPLVVKQGLATTTAGRGEINAAFESLASITQVFMPAVWVFLFRLCYEAKGGSALVALVGPGGHFLVAAVVRMLGRQIVCSIDTADLSVEDEA